MSSTGITTPSSLAELISSVMGLITVSFKPDKASVIVTTNVCTDVASLVTKGLIAKITLSLRVPSFHWPYSIVSASMTSTKTWIKPCPENNTSPASPIKIMFIGKI